MNIKLFSCILIKFYLTYQAFTDGKRKTMTKPNEDSQRSWAMGTAIVIMILASCLISGCAGVGPPTVARDRFDYVSAISESWKQQTLLNLLKTRYADAPVFMDVTSVINQYAVEGQIELGASWAESPLSNSQNVAGSGKYTDRPTITYSPLMGEKFTKSLMTPIPVPGILFLLQSGYPADYVIRVTVHTINGIENQFGGSMTGRAADHRFKDLITSLRMIQLAGGLGMRVKPEGDRKAIVMFFRPVTDESIANELKKAQELLGLNADAREFRVAYGSFAADDREIAILSRSMLQIMVDFASFIDVPPSDVAEGRVYASEDNDGEGDFPPLIRVANSTSKPGDAYTAVRYRDR